MCERGRKPWVGRKQTNATHAGKLAGSDKHFKQSELRLMKNEKNCRKTNEPDIRCKIFHITQISAKYLDCLSVYFNGSAIYRSFRDVRYRAVAYFRNSLGAKSRQKNPFYGSIMLTRLQHKLF